MDGFKRRLSESVQLKLSFTLTMLILAVGALAGVFSFVSAFEEAHELQDDVLRQVAQLMDSQRLPVTPPIAAARPADSDEDAQVIVQRLDDGNRFRKAADGGRSLSLPARLRDGLHNLEVGGETFRVLVKTTAAGQRIAVAQDAGFRNDIARDSALRTVMPFLVLVPALGLIVARLVRKMFQPIATLSKAIDRRAEQDLDPVEDSHLPIEVRPFAMAINRMLGRVGKAMDTQRRFVADAAHELRSPLTALSLQAERLAETDMSDEARKRLDDLRQGILRGRSLLDQLLALARAQSSAESPGSPVSIQGMYRRVLEELMPMAEAKHIDIGVEGREDAQVWVGELDMTALLRNLVDNAIRYTPEGGRIDLSVSVANGEAVLRVDDTGPGIEVVERDRVFDPFYRTLGNEQSGSGLGLSIVQAIARRIGAKIQLGFSNAEKQTGLRVDLIVRVAAPSGLHDAASPGPAVRDRHSGAVLLRPRKQRRRG
jgi:two-component system OmpR family sensor kinase